MDAVVICPRRMMIGLAFAAISVVGGAIHAAEIVIDERWWNEVVANDDPHAVENLKFTDGTLLNLGSLIGIGGHSWVYLLRDDTSLVIKVATDQSADERNVFAFENYHAVRLANAGFDVAPVSTPSAEPKASTRIF